MEDVESKPFCGCKSGDERSESRTVYGGRTGDDDSESRVVRAQKMGRKVLNVEPWTASKNWRRAFKSRNMGCVSSGEIRVVERSKK